MIEKIQIINFEQSTGTAENFSISLGNEGSFKLIRSMIITSDTESSTVVWGFSATPDGVDDVDIVGVNGLNGPLWAGVPNSVIDNTSMTGTTHAYMRFSVTHAIGAVLELVITYYSFEGLTSPTTSIVTGSIDAANSATITYGTSPQLEIIKSLWVSPSLTGVVTGSIQLVNASGQSNVNLINLNNRCANAIPSSFGIWIPDNTTSILIGNADTSTSAMTYYLTGIGRP